MNICVYGASSKSIDEKYIKTVELYKDFLVLNESFIKTKTTADLKLPSKLKPLDKNDLNTVGNLISQTVNDGDFERLYNISVL